MNLFKHCEQCKHKTLWFLIKNRTITFKGIVMKSQSKLCNRCYKGFKKIKE